MSYSFRSFIAPLKKVDTFKIPLLKLGLFHSLKSITKILSLEQLFLIAVIRIFRQMKHQYTFEGELRGTVIPIS